MMILVVDGQGGGLGRLLVRELKGAFPQAEIAAVGTNSTAANAMMKAGADFAATGENAVVVNCRHADIIVGAVGIVIADSMWGEITPRMAQAVGQSTRGACSFRSISAATSSSACRRCPCQSWYRLQSIPFAA